MYSKDSVKTYTFATIAFSVRNYRGLYILSDKVKASIAALSLSEAQAVNRDAWKQKRANGAVADRHCNYSMPGNIGIHEDAYSHYDVASQVAKESYKRMMRG